MTLSEYKVVAGLAVSDMDRAREFYEGKLGLVVGIDSDDNVAYRCAAGSVLHVYLSTEHAGKSRATLASWYVDDVEGVVDKLTSKGVAFENFDVGPIITDEKGIATFEGEPRSPTSGTRMATPCRSPRSRIPDRAQSPSMQSTLGKGSSPKFDCLVRLVGFLH
jgi:extradiol dioxygenase family protein